MTRVRIIRNVQAPALGIFGVGQDLDLPDVVAATLIAQGAAIETKDAPNEPRVVDLKVTDTVDLIDPRDPKPAKKGKKKEK